MMILKFCLVLDSKKPEDGFFFVATVATGVDADGG